MNEEILKPIVIGMKDKFNSHDVIKELMESQPAIYNNLLDRYGNVKIAHSQIGISLIRFADKIGIEKTGVIYDKSLGYPSECAEWRKI